MKTLAYPNKNLVRILFLHLTFLSLLCSCEISDPTDSLSLLRSRVQNLFLGDVQSVDFDDTSDYINSETSFTNISADENRQVIVNNSIVPNLLQQVNQTEIQSSDSENPDQSDVFESEFDYRADNETDFSWLADYNISELEPSELFFPSKYTQPSTVNV